MSLFTTENTRNKIVLGDNLEYLKAIPDGSIRMIYIDPPFNTGHAQKRESIEVVRASDGTRKGFGGNTYKQKTKSSFSYQDAFTDYLAWLEPRLDEAWRILSEDGTLYLHLDYRESHYAKVLLDQKFGRDKFLNDIVWAYDYGGKPKTKFPPKHDNILVYVKNTKEYVFNAEEIDREPYMAPGLVTEEKRKRGKMGTDVIWHTIVSPNGKEKTGYPTQKPKGLLRRFIQASSNPGDIVLDFFAGSGALGATAADLGRGYILVDKNPEAFYVMKGRFAGGDLGEDAEFIDLSGE